MTTAPNGHTPRMTAFIIVLAIVVLVAVVAGVALASKRRSAAGLERRRVEASEVRDQAVTHQAKARELEAEAQERAARSRREAAVAEQRQQAAANASSTAQDLHTRASEIDPDTPADD